MQIAVRHALEIPCKSFTQRVSAAAVGRIAPGTINQFYSILINVMKYVAAAAASWRLADCDLPSDRGETGGPVSAENIVTLRVYSLHV